LVLLNLVGVFLLASVAPAPSYLRLSSVCLPALITLVYFASQAGVLEKGLLIVLWTAGLTLALTAPIRRQHQWKAYLDLPIGRTAFLNPSIWEEVRWVSERVRPSDLFFGDQGISFALQLRNPAQVDSLTATDYTRPEQVADVIHSLEQNRVPYLVLWDFTDLESWDFALDGDNRGASNHLGPIINYISSHYHVVKRFPSDDLVWQRNP
jgi:hypothetical protein